MASWVEHAIWEIDKLSENQYSKEFVPYLKEVNDYYHADKRVPQAAQVSNVIPFYRLPKMQKDDPMAQLRRLLRMHVQCGD